MAVEGFEEAIKCLENLKLESGEASLEQRVATTYPCVLPFIHALLFVVLLTDFYHVLCYFCSVSRFSTFYKNNWMTSDMHGSNLKSTLTGYMHYP